MKLFGNSGKRQKTAKEGGQSSRGSVSRERTDDERREIEEQIASYQRFKMKRRIIVLSIIVVILVGAFVLWKLNIKPPVKNSGGLLTPGTTDSGSTNEDSNKPDDSQKPGTTPAEDVNSGSESTAREEGCYTFLVVGSDNGYGNTDTIMVGMLDTGKKELNILSIPRDTLVNVPWGTKKVNTLLAYSKLDGLLSGISAIMGYEIDNYAIIDLEAFVKIVDTVGGVWYDVPQDMKYTAEDQDPPLYIDVKQGYQLLDGDHAMQVMRFRSGYASADIGRIGTQQEFLMAMAKQCIDLGNVFKIDSFVKIFEEYVDTSLTDGNVLWYAKTILGLSAENINFYTLPANYNDSVKGFSYCSINIDEWLQLLNEKFNPWNVDITVDNLDILTRDANKKLYATTGTIAGGMDSFADYDKLFPKSTSSGSGEATAPETGSTEPAGMETAPETSPDPSDPGTEQPTESTDPPAVTTDTPTGTDASAAGDNPQGGETQTGDGGTAAPAQ